MAVYTAIDDPSAHFQVKAYTGTGGTDEAFTNDGNSDLQPDLIWIKPRNFADNHVLTDSTRGVDVQLYANLTVGDDSFTIGVESFDSDGFSLNSWNNVNDTDDTFVAWQWKANGGSRTTNAEDGNNPAGGYQANTTAGFSIVDYTGTGAAGTMAHGLGAVPDLIMVKNRDENDAWAVYHSANTAAPETDYLVLDTTAATADDDAFWNDTAPTSTVFTVNTAHNVNADGENYIAYCFRSVQGYSKFGIYTGNGDDDGTFVYLGFKPAWVLTKQNGGNNYWHIHDNKRNPFNVVGKELKANVTFVEADPAGGENNRDFVSNGFKFTDYDHNNHAYTYIYMAFAEQPFVTSGGVPCTGGG
jgi:hypothetical protein